MAFYLILSLILIFPFYYLSFGVALFFYAALLVTGMIAKYRSMSILRWIAVIQAACSLALVAHVYQRYGIFVTLISVIVFLFFFLLTVPAPEKEASPPLAGEYPSPPAVNAPASEISLVKAEDVRTHAHFYFNSYCHKNGYDIALLPLISDYANRATFNNALLQQLHTATATFSQLCGRILTTADTPHILPGGLYAFRDTQKHRIGLQSGEFGLIFTPSNFTCLRITERTCRGDYSYELSLETDKQRIFLHHPHECKPVTLYQWAIELTVVWQIPLQHSYINDN